MSLIHEALKRAQAEQAARRTPGAPSVHLPAVAVPRAPVPRKASPVVAAVTAAMVVSIGLAAIVVFKLHVKPASATASPAPLISPAPAAAISLDQLPALPDDTDAAPRATLIDSRSLSHAASAPAKPRLAAAGVTASAAAPADSPAAPRGKAKGSPRQAVESYVLSGIMHGITGDAALINGRLLKEGDSVDGAVVKRISEYQVILERDGRQITLSM